MTWHYVTTFEKWQSLERHPVVTDCGVQINHPVVATGGETKKDPVCSVCDSAYDFRPLTDKRETYVVRESYVVRETKA